MRKVQEIVCGALGTSYLDGTAGPDTVINLATGNRFLVKNSVDDVIAKTVEYKTKVYSERKCINPLEGFEK